MNLLLIYSLSDEFVINILVKLSDEFDLLLIYSLSDEYTRY